MSRLTEEMVLARGKESDLRLIKRLNCWGCELSDVSIINRLSGVVVLGLPLNRISTLSPFQGCHKLQELYLRRNNIADISELEYLKDLPVLRQLCLQENPVCMRAVNYRSEVLRALPNLTKLDNVDVTQQEVAAALRGGGASEGSGGAVPEEVVHEEVHEEVYVDVHQPEQLPQRSSPPQIPQQMPQQSQPAAASHYHSYPQPTPPAQQPQHRWQPHPEELPSGSGSISMVERRVHPPSPRYARSPVSDQESRPQRGYRQVRPTPLPSSFSTSVIQSDPRAGYPGLRRYSHTDRTQWQEHQPGPLVHHNPYGRPGQQCYPTQCRSELSCAINPNPGHHRTSGNSSSNVLSASLCLVREMDYDSLQMLDQAIQSRLDEMWNER